jgi:FkbM family methyltransferase
MLTSYAQNFEDVILWRALKHVERGFYIDIGAQDPVVDSVSLAFYEKGWRGVHVEPVAAYARKLREARPDEEVIEAAIAEQAGTIAFWEFPDTGLSTGDPAIAEGHQGEGRQCCPSAVPCMPLSAILERYRDREIHWLKIDVEGMEARVVAGWEPSGVRPWIVVVESTRPNSPEATHAKWEPLLIGLGYDFVYFDGLNRFYLSRERSELRPAFGPGPNVFDGFVLAAVAERDRTVAELAARVAEGEAQHAALAETLAERDRTVVELAARVAEGEAQHAALAETLAERDRTVAELAARVAEGEAQHAALAETLADRDRTVAELAARVAEREARIAQLHQSTSWRLTAPLRSLKRSARWFTAGAWAWLTLKPGSRPRRMARRIVQRAIAAGEARPELRRHIVSLSRRLGWLPVLRRLRDRVAVQPEPLAAAAPANRMMAGIEIGHDTTPWTRHMLSRLMAARAGRKGMA